MDAEQYADHVEREGHLLVAAAEGAGLEAPVPTCPGWTVTELLRHVTFVHRWATKYLVEELIDMQPHVGEAAVLKTGPSGPELLTYVDDGIDELARAIRDAPVDLKCWTFMRDGTPRIQWARRQTHETTIHRADAELAGGHTVSPVTADVATDGIDELLRGFFGRDLTDEKRGTIGIRPTDGGVTWSIDMTATKAHGHFDPDPVDVWIDAPASDLYFALWHRGQLAALCDRSDDDPMLQLWDQRAIRW